MKDKILIFGAFQGETGWLAGKLKKHLDNSMILETDITDLQKVRMALLVKDPDIVINAAGITGRPNIDWCRDHAKETISVNTVGAFNIALACAEKDIYWVHLSSGCIFQGYGPDNKGFKEADKPNPPSFYSWTKYWAEQIIQSVQNNRVLILRLRLPIDIEPHPRNLINKLIKYPEVWNPQNSITSIPAFLSITKTLINERETGIFHVVSPGTISPSRIMEIYQEIVDPAHQFTEITEDQFYEKGLAIEIRSNCSLDTTKVSEKLAEQKCLLFPVELEVREVMERYNENSQK